MLKPNFNLFAFFCCLLLSSCVQANNCELDNAALQVMPYGQVTIIREDGSSLQLPVKIANDSHTRAAGFQRVCEATIESMPILFVFPSAVQPSFHMNNVLAPIDIVFISESGSVDSFHSMRPYVVMSSDKPRYTSSGKIVAALEVHEGFFSQHDIATTAKFSWKLGKPQ